MDNIQKLKNTVKAILDAANKRPINIGALRGTMVSRDTVLIEGKTYHAIEGTQVNMYPGTMVWCQLSSNSEAVIIGA